MFSTRRSSLTAGQYPCHSCTSQEIFSVDSWKFSIPAVLYVIQNSLQSVAISNIPVATFQVTYQISDEDPHDSSLLRRPLTQVPFAYKVDGPLFPCSLCRNRSTPIRFGQWSHAQVGQYSSWQCPLCRTGVYPHHEPPERIWCGDCRVSHVWARRCLLRDGPQGLQGRPLGQERPTFAISLVPALFPVVFSNRRNSQGFFKDLLRNFCGWAWGTIAVQTFGGSITAVVIKYSDNVLEGFATSLAIILTFFASVAPFDFKLAPSFSVGGTIVLAATWMYNQPAGKETVTLPIPARPSTPFNETPSGSPKVAATALGGKSEVGYLEPGHFGDVKDTNRYLDAPYGSPWRSRTPSSALSTLSLPRTPLLDGEGRLWPL